MTAMTATTAITAMNPTLVQAIWTLLAFVVFVGIVAWAWSRRAGRGFAEAERSPFADDAGEAGPKEGASR